MTCFRCNAVSAPNPLSHEGLGPRLRNVRYEQWVESGIETKGGAGIHYRMFIYYAELSCYVKTTVTAVSETHVW